MTSDLKKTNAERIEILRSTENIINTFLHILHNANTKWDWFADSKALSLPLAFEAIKKAIFEAKARGTRLRFITEITKENMALTKEFMDILELRHFEGVKGNFGVSDFEYIAISTTTNAHLGDSKSTTRAIIPHAVYSNVIEVIRQQQCVFVLWNNTTPAEKRIKEIEKSTTRWYQNLGR